ncbi:MAG: biotin/lipoyl-binding carrier protein [Actinobacteria bacterium]|nr:biotin/lipoyl-binding carrier protein [Actinomycetota bacterium]NBP92023.1 biotin/lipoyl-binding carrier protein [Actinomycetota bacterium]
MVMAHFDVRAEMVANVLTITVKVGDVVEAGDQLLLLESMKMEIPVLSEVSGKVIEVAVVDGEVIQGGDLLVKIEYR